MLALIFAIKWRIRNKTLSFPVFRTNWTTREKCFTIIISVITLWLKCLSSPSPRMDWLCHHEHKHHDHHTTIKTIINITIHNAFSVQFCQISPYESIIMDIVCFVCFWSQPRWAKFSWCDQYGTQNLLHPNWVQSGGRTNTAMIKTNIAPKLTSSYSIFWELFQSQLHPFLTSNHLQGNFDSRWPLLLPTLYVLKGPPDLKLSSKSWSLQLGKWTSDSD